MAPKGRAFMAIGTTSPAQEKPNATAGTHSTCPSDWVCRGVLVGRRYVDWNLDHQRWFTLYETKTLEILSSEDYRVRLNNPTN